MEKLQVLLIATVFAVVSVNGHGRFMKPPGRSSVWRIKEFADQHPPINYDDDQLYCGAIHQAEHPGSNCGVCGDPFSRPQPRDNEVGGKYDKGIIVGNFKSGEVVDIEINLTAAHAGFMEWRLCTNPQSETQECFNQNLLQLGDGTGSRYPVSKTGWHYTKVKLPAGVTCERCVIQWNYRAGNNWGQCEDGSFGMGCGPQETFRSCADISIS